MVKKAEIKNQGMYAREKENQHFYSFVIYSFEFFFFFFPSLTSYEWYFFLNVNLVHDLCASSILFMGEIVVVGKRM